MVESAAIYPVPLRVAADAANVALGDLRHQPLDRAARASEVEQLDLARAMIEVQPALPRAAVDTAALPPDLVQFVRFRST